MTAHLFGALALLGSAALVAVAGGVVLFGLARGDRTLAKRASLVALAWIAVYGVGLLLSPLTAPPRVLLPGGEISFCGLDCHLHISVVDSAVAAPAQSAATQAVTVRARSDAKRAPEYPAELRFRLVDAEDREYFPVPESGRFVGPLAAGEADTITLAFAPPADAHDLRLRVTWDAWPDLLLLGPANTRAVARTTLALSGPAR
jgi:hypothetical protein